MVRTPLILLGFCFNAATPQVQSPDWGTTISNNIKGNGRESKRFESIHHRFRKISPKNMQTFLSAADNIP